MVLAVVATYFAASRPARAITKVPIVAALSGRPAPPRQIHRSAIPGIVLLAVAFLLLGVLGEYQWQRQRGCTPNSSSDSSLLIPGNDPARAVLSVARRTDRPERRRSRPGSHFGTSPGTAPAPGSALAAISLGVLVAVIVSLAAASRYGNVLDYAGPNLSSNQLALSANTPPPAGTVSISPGGKPTVAKAPSSAVASPAELARSADRIAAALGAQAIALESPNARSTTPARGGAGTDRSTSPRRSCSRRSGSGVGDPTRRGRPHGAARPVRCLRLVPHLRRQRQRITATETDRELVPATHRPAQQRRAASPTRSSRK